MKQLLSAMLIAWSLAGIARAAGRAAPGPRRIEYALTIWDWCRNYRDLARFHRLVEQACAIGFNTIELSVAWKDIQPRRQGEFDWDHTDRRVSCVLDKGLRLRVRVNFSYARPWPAWVRPVLAEGPDGKRAAVIMTIFDDELNALQVAATRGIVDHYRDKGIEWCPVFGVHTEHKLSSWLSYEPPARVAFRAWLRKRYGSREALARAWGRAKPPTRWDDLHPPVVRPTGRSPDLRAETCDWIAFREEAVAAKVAGLLAAVRAADPRAATSVILGESYRRGSANMTNLAYRPYSRRADRVIFAYDFTWHGRGDREASAVSLAILRGITGKPTVFEFGGPAMIERNEYTDDDLTHIGRLVLAAGAAGLNLCNYSYTDKPLTAFPHVSALAAEVARRNAAAKPAAAEPAELYYLSKWASYCLRDPRDEWVHRKQLAAYRAMGARAARVRIVSDDNLLEEAFPRVSGVHVAPPLVIDARAAERLRALAGRAALDPPHALTGAAVLDRRAPRAASDPTREPPR